mmetsp:Transcript_54646/g.91066  ORF Transcript_54646/g.91066 Transcript_54646/m.91066 type:complete len:80 (+) Transcript_54646:2413-2652(+)
MTHTHTSSRASGLFTDLSYKCTKWGCKRKSAPKTHKEKDVAIVSNKTKIPRVTYCDSMNCRLPQIGLVAAIADFVGQEL